MCMNVTADWVNRITVFFIQFKCIVIVISPHRKTYAELNFGDFNRISIVADSLLSNFTCVASGPYFVVM